MDNGCYVGEAQQWTNQQIESFSFGQRIADALRITTKAFTGSGLFKTQGGNVVYDGTMIRAEDVKNQRTRLSTFTPGENPSIIRK
jgi:hypothetical protein